MVVTFLLLCLNVPLQSPILGSISAFFYFVAFIALMYTQDIFHGKHEFRLFAAVVLVLAYTSISNSLFYYIYEINQYTVLLTLMIPFLWYIRQPEPMFLYLDPVVSKIREFLYHVRKTSRVYLYVFTAIEACLFYLLWQARTAETLISPWQNLDPVFFLLFALNTFLLFAITSKKILSVRWTVGLHMIHFFLIYSITIIVYQLGFGYDGFVHRAAQQYILDNGIIEPKTPFYIGQYSLVVVFAQLTKLPVFFIDSLMVPLYAAILIPWSIFLGLHYGLKTPFHESLIVAWVLPWIYPLSLHLTTPHNFVLMLFVITMFVGLHKKNFTTFLLMMALGVFALFTHPLLGLPLFIFTSAWTLFGKKTPKWFLPLFTLAAALCVPAMFGLHNYLQGNGLPQTTNPLFGLSSFAELFHLPYWVERYVNLFWDGLYMYGFGIAPLAGILGLYSYLRFRKKHPIFNLYFAFSLAMVVCAFALRIWIQFPGLASFEQDDYPKRMLIAALIPLLPMIMFWLSNWHGKLKIQMRIAVCIIFALVTMLSLYFAYPQVNPKVQFPGYNMTIYDVEATKYIHQDADGQDYIVLSNALVATAALQEYGFAKYYDIDGFDQFYYSTPSGSPLYQQYQKMVYQDTKREYMEQAMQMAGVTRAYFVINEYWSNYPVIVMRAKQNSDAYAEIGDNKIFVFTYLLENPNIAQQAE